jgi:hypothetical protein
MSTERKIITSRYVDGKVKDGRDAGSLRTGLVRQTRPQPFSTANVSPDFESHTVLSSPQEKKKYACKELLRGSEEPEAMC